MIGTKIRHNGTLSQKTLDNIKTGVNRRLNARQKQKARAEQVNKNNVPIHLLAIWRHEKANTLARARAVQVVSMSMHEKH